MNMEKIFNVKTGKVIVFIDKSNLHYSLREAGWEIDYHRLYNLFRDQFPEKFDVYYFEGYFPDKCPGLSQNQEREETRKQKKFRFFDKLRTFGYIVDTKPINSVYDFTSGGYTRKCNFDVEITIKAMDKLNHYETYIFFSGDGDFTKLLKYLKGKFKQTIVISTSKRTSNSLMRAANQYINLNNIKQLIERK